ncbi:MAG: hypothetical protein ABIK07_20365 [Planctomycetota bacterium]
MLLFPDYETEIGVPKETTTHDFEVPGKSQQGLCISRSPNNTW